MINGGETLERSPADAPWVCWCVCVPMKMRVGTRGSSVSRRPNDANPLKRCRCFFPAHLRLDVVWGLSPRRWASLAVFARPALNPSVCFTHQSMVNRRKNKMTYLCHLRLWYCAVLVLHVEFCFLSQSASQFTYLFRNRQMCLMDLLYFYRR